MASVAELRLRIGDVEIAVTGTSREDCLRQIEAACREVEQETGAPGEVRYRITPEGEAALRVSWNAYLERTLAQQQEAAEAQAEVEYDAWRNR